MHELSLSRQIAAIVERAADGRPVREVELDVGHLRQVVPETLEYCWGLVVGGGPLDGAALRIRRIEAVVACRECGASTTLRGIPMIRCGTCGAAAVDVVSGEEFLVRSIEVGDADPTDGESPTTKE